MKELNVCHLYGNLMNTYGDIGNLLVMDYYCKKMGVHVNYDLISLHDTFDPEKYDFVLFGGGQDFEQSVIADDLQEKKEALNQYIQNNGTMLAVCGGYQLIGKYYIDANGNKIPGVGALPHYTRGQEEGEERLIGNVKIHNDHFDEDYIGFENHGGRTFLGEGEEPLGTVLEGNGNNGTNHGEGVVYKNTFGTYFHGPILARNENLAVRLINIAMKERYGDDYQEVTLEELQNK